MEEIISIGKTLIEAGSYAPLVGLLVVLAVPKLRNKVFGNGADSRIKELEDFKELAESNHFHDLNDLKEDMKEIKHTINEIDKRVVIIEVKMQK